MDKDDKNSANSTEDDTWTLVDDSVKFGIPPIIISTENKENEENCQDDENDNKKLNVHDDSDDGISVISESELLKNSSANSDNEEKLVDLPKLTLHPELRQSLLERTVDTEDEIKYEPITPPSTPHNNLMSLRQRNQSIDLETPSLPCTSHFSWIAFALIGVSMAFLLGNFLDLKDSIEAIGTQFEQRILNLEVQNDLLRSQISRLKAQQSTVDQEEIDEDPIMLDLTTVPSFESPEDIIVPPPTKKVWLGDGEEEHFVKILDKKFALPDYCFYENEDDLFNEYNSKVCDEKQRKLDRKLSSRDDKKYKSNFKESTPENFVEESANVEPIQDENKELRGAEGSGGRPKKFKKFKESKNYKEGKKYKDSIKDLNIEEKSEILEEQPLIKNEFNTEKFDKREKLGQQDDRFKKSQDQKQYLEKEDKKSNKKFKKNEDKENQQNYKNSREGSGNDSNERKQYKRKSDTDKNYRRNGTRQKLGSGEWHNKLMKSRDEIRDEIRKQKQTNWYLERANEREIQRVDLTSQQANASEP